MHEIKSSKANCDTLRNSPIQQNRFQIFENPSIHSLFILWRVCGVAAEREREREEDTDDEINIMTFNVSEKINK